MSEVVACENGRPNAALSRLQSCQKAILSEVLDFCRVHEISCVLAAGSALGAARHEDIIPWDDDIDIAMMRSDLKRFEAAWLKEYDGPLTLHSPRTERAYPLDFLKIRKPGTAMHEPELDGSGMVDGIYIDIFAFDHLPPSTIARGLQRAGLSVLSLVIMSFSKATTRNSNSRLVRGLRRLSLALRPILPWRTLISLRERLSALGTPATSKQIICFEMYGLGHSARTIAGHETIFPTATGTFGEMAVPMPHDTDAYLTGLFGDWRSLPPKDQRQPPHARLVNFGD